MARPHDEIARERLTPHDADTALGRWFHAYKVDIQAEFASKRDILEVQEIRKPLPRGRELLEYKCWIYSEWPDAPPGRLVGISPGAPPPPSFLRPAPEPYEPPPMRPQPMRGAETLPGTATAVGSFIGTWEPPAGTFQAFQDMLTKAITGAFKVPSHRFTDTSGGVGPRRVIAGPDRSGPGIDIDPADLDMGELFILEAHGWVAEARFTLSVYAKGRRRLALEARVLMSQGPDRMLDYSWIIDDGRYELGYEQRQAVLAMARKMKELPPPKRSLGPGTVSLDGRTIGRFADIEWNSSRQPRYDYDPIFSAEFNYDRQQRRAEELRLLAGYGNEFIKPTGHMGLLNGADSAPPPASPPAAEPPAPEPPPEPPEKRRNY